MPASREYGHDLVPVGRRASRERDLLVDELTGAVGDLGPIVLVVAE